MLHKRNVDTKSLYCGSVLSLFFSVVQFLQPVTPQLPHKHTRTHHRLRLSTHAGFMGSLYLSHSMCSSSPSGHKSSRHRLEQLCLRFIDEAISHIKTLFLKLNTFDVHDVICRIQLYVTVYASCTHTQIQGRCCKRVQ